MSASDSKSRIVKIIKASLTLFAFRRDPYPYLEPLMEIHDVLAQENLVYNHINSGFLWMKKSAVMAEAWQSVLEMDLIADSRDQFNLNTVCPLSHVHAFRFDSHSNLIACIGARNCCAPTAERSGIRRRDTSAE